MKIISTTTYKDFNRPDIRLLSKDMFLPQPAVLVPGKDEDKALEILESALGFDTSKRTIVIKTPIEKVLIKADNLRHVVEKRDHARERYANYIISTLMYPFEIYLTEYEIGFRNQYIGLFKGKNSVLTVVKVKPDGSLFWNAMNCNTKKMNSHRVGKLIYDNKKCPPA